MKIFFMIATALVFNIFLFPEIIFSMEENKEEVERSTRFTCAICSNVIRTNKKWQEEVWESVKFIGDRANHADKELRNVGYDLHGLEDLLTRRLDGIDEKLITMQNRISVIEENVQLLKDRRKASKLLPEKKPSKKKLLDQVKKLRRSKDDSGDLSSDESLLHSLPFPDEKTITKKKPTDENLPI